MSQAFQCCAHLRECAHALGPVWAVQGVEAAGAPLCLWLCEDWTHVALVEGGPPLGYLPLPLCRTVRGGRCVFSGSLPDRCKPATGNYLVRPGFLGSRPRYLPQLAPARQTRAGTCAIAGIWLRATKRLKPCPSPDFCGTFGDAQDLLALEHVGQTLSLYQMG